MKIFKTVLIASLFSVNAWAGTAEVTWHEPGKYRDVQAAEELQTRFQERVFSEFEKHFDLLAAKLPENQTLKIIVTDVDLAGEVELQHMGGSLRSLRMVRSSDFPSIEFSYELVTAEGEVLIEGQER